MSSVASDNGAFDRAGDFLPGWRWWLACAIVLALALAATLPTTGDLGLTWDEPAYRYSQVISAQWWERLAGARSRGGRPGPDRARRPALLLALRPARDQLPPAAGGQLNLATHAPARPLDEGHPGAPAGVDRSSTP